MTCDVVFVEDDFSESSKFSDHPNVSAELLEDPSPNPVPIGIVSGPLQSTLTDQITESPSVVDLSLPQPSQVMQEVPDHQPVHPMMTRAQTGIRRPNPKYVLQISAPPTQPRNAKSALESLEWKNAMFTEINDLHRIQMWSLVPRKN